MAFVNWYRGDGSVLPAHGLQPSGPFFITVDAFETNITSGDILLLTKLPVGTLVRCVALEVVTPEGGTMTVDIGDHTTAATPVAVDADGYLDGVDANAAAGTYYCSTPGSLTEGTPNVYNEPYAQGAFYGSAAHWLTMTVNNDADAMILRVWVDAVQFKV